MTIKAVVFDMDGVLIDAKEWHYEALNQSLGLFGFAISREDHERRFDGLPTRTKLLTLSQEMGLPVALHGFINRMKQHYTAALARRHLQPNPLHLYALKTLRAEGYRLGVASNSIRSTIELMMSLAGLAPYLDFVLSNEDVQHPKPAPEIYLKALVMADVHPNECLVLEDNPFGWQAAEDAGAHLLKIGVVNEVNYGNIRRVIADIESQPAEAGFASLKRVA